MRKPALLLVGYGRFGSFAAKMLRSRFTVHVLESRRSVKLARGLIRASLRDVATFDLAILSLPALRLRRFLGRNGHRFRDGAFVADLCAVKIAPMNWLQTHLSPNVSYSGLHPLFGPDSAATGVRGHSVAVCRGRSSGACHRRLIATLRAIGLKPIETNPLTHDKSMASSLFLTQFIGETVTSAGAPSPAPLSTAGFRHLEIICRRAAGNAPDLIRELYRFNPYCEKSLQTLLRRVRRKTESLRIQGKIY